MPTEAREVLDAYLALSPSTDSEPLFRSRSREGMARQHVDRVLRHIARQAGSKLPADEQIRLSAHVVRHTMLRKFTQKYGVPFALETAGHAPRQYFWKYVEPSDEALEELFLAGNATDTRHP